MTDHDPDPDRHRETAVTAVARLLAPRLLPGMDADHIARQAVDLLHGQGWRPIPRPPATTASARPGDYAAGAARAREELAKALAETEGDTHG